MLWGKHEKALKLPYKRDPFAWGEKRAAPSLYEVTFVHDAIRYQYGFVVDDERVLEEWLYAWPGARKQVWFEREDDVKFGENLKGENRLVGEVTRANALLLSVAAQHGHKQLGEVYRWFVAATFQNLQRSNFLALDKKLYTSLGQNTASAAAEAVGDYFERSAMDGLRRFLTAADVGILDVKVAKSGGGGRLANKTYLLHKSDVVDAWLPLAEESAGTKSLFAMAKPVLNVLARGGVLVVDELERSLHPLLALPWPNRAVGRVNGPPRACRGPWSQRLGTGARNSRS